ncbi:unnamed protein product [Staurois parvus]|uniref:Uncharacterized protein n=1 Tax=Staurois parvus TaxID=386267 RepID=A0ABN9HFU5_9NEOB|nr:unnamed protein product [Staurois parvus]
MFTPVRFHPVLFWKGSATFLNAKSCIFGSIDFNGNASEKHVLCFYSIFYAFCFLNLPSNKKKKKRKKNAVKTQVQKCKSKRNAEMTQTQPA